MRMICPHIFRSRVLPLFLIGISSFLYFSNDALAISTQKKSPKIGVPSGAQQAPQEAIRNRVQFAKKQLRLADKTIVVEIAETQIQQQMGLMHREQLADGTGMLFVYPEESKLSFWMKNTLIPLSIGFFDADRELLEILDMEVDPVLIRDQKRPRYRSKYKAQYALEVPKGWFHKHKIKPGSKFQLQELKINQK